MKFRIIKDHKEPEMTVIIENGGIACIRQSSDEELESITDYYHDPINRDECNSDNVYEILAEGKMSVKEWKTERWDSDIVKNDALSWLAPHETVWEECNDLFVDIIPS